MLKKNYILQRCFTLLLVLCAIATNAYAQVAGDSLQEVQVKGERVKNVSNDARVNVFAPGQKVQSIDSATLQQYQLQNIANLLTQQVPVFVKSYGFNSLATLNFRGSSAAQSEVLWNGVPIQNAALGISDVSELPVLLMNKVNVVYGSSSALWGSGNVGGALLVEDKEPVFSEHKKEGLSVSLGAGSFGQKEGGFNTHISSKRWYFSLNGFGQVAKNNFSYTNSNGQTEHMDNSRLASGALTLQSAYKIGTNNVISLSAWYQQCYREIPPALFESISTKNKKDESLRLLLSWNKRKGMNEWYAKEAFTRDYMLYRDDTIALNTENTTYQDYFEAGWKRILNDHSQLLVFTPVQIAWMVLPSGNQQQTKIALAAAYNTHYFRDKLNVAINGRAEVVNSNSYLLPGADASYKLTDWLKVRANVQRTYRVPTLNELYYFPGGNTSLKPEQGWNEDAGYTLQFHINKRLFFYHDASFFNRVINDWIVWFGGAVWTPHNIATVHSRGIETENRLQWQLHKWKIHVGLNTSYVLATTQSSYIQNDGSIGKQIPYTPRYNGQLNIGFSYKSFYFNYNHTYTGYRFITTDESEYIEPYNTGNIQFRYSWQLFHKEISVNAQCNNIWNAHYRVVAYRPMPGINWLLGVKLVL